jgi:hypothetical protein
MRVFVSYKHGATPDEHQRPTHPDPDFYTMGGTLMWQAPSYITRAAD